MDSCVLAFLCYIRVPVGIKTYHFVVSHVFSLFSVSRFLSKFLRCTTHTCAHTHTDMRAHTQTHTVPGLDLAESLRNKSCTVPGERDRCKSASAVESLPELINECMTLMHPLGNCCNPSQRNSAVCLILLGGFILVLAASCFECLGRN